MRQAIAILSLLLAGVASAQCVGPYCHRTHAVPMPPPVIYQPRVQVQFQPMYHQGTVVTPRVWQGPVWTGFLGRYRFGNFYAPRQPLTGFQTQQ